MFGEHTKATLIKITVGIAGGLCVPRFFDPFIALVDKLSSCTNIYSVGKSMIDCRKESGDPWTAWDYYSLLRDYFATSFLRGLISQTIHMYLDGRFQEFDLAQMCVINLDYMWETVLGLIVVVSFWRYINTIFGLSLIYGCSTLFRINESMSICNRFADLESDALNTVLRYSFLNGASTLMTYTVIDILFLGDLRILDSWLSVRMFFIAIPYLYVYFQELGLDRMHRQFIHAIRTTLGDQLYFGINYGMTDGRRMMTVFMLVFANFIVGPHTKFISRWHKLH